MDEQESNVGHSGHGGESEALPSAPRGRGGPLTPRSDKDYQKDEYMRANAALETAKEIIKLYEKMGIPPCEIPRIHAAVRSSFGYSP